MDKSLPAEENRERRSGEEGYSREISLLVRALEAIFHQIREILRKIGGVKYFRFTGCNIQEAILHEYVLEMF